MTRRIHNAGFDEAGRVVPTVDPWGEEVLPVNEEETLNGPLELQRWINKGKGRRAWVARHKLILWLIDPALRYMRLCDLARSIREATDYLNGHLRALAREWPMLADEIRRRRRQRCPVRRKSRRECGGSVHTTEHL